MRRLPLPFTLAAFLAQEGALESRAGQVPRLRVGESIAGSLTPGDPVSPDRGPSKRFEIGAEEAGPITISLESLDFDAFLAVETETGEKLAEDDNGGIETNARVVLEAKAGSRYRIVAVAKKGGAGEFSLSVARGEVPRPSRAALLEAGRAFHRSAAERALARGDHRAAAVHRLLEGRRLYAGSRFREAKDVGESFLALARELGDRGWEGAAYSDLGLAHHALGDFRKAKEYHERQLALAREMGDRANEAGALLNLGNVYDTLGEYPKARECHEKCLGIARELGDRLEEGKALGGLAGIYYSLGDFSRAREHYEKALAIALEVGDRADQSVALGNLGLVSRALGDYAKSREYHERDLALCREMGDRAGGAVALENLGLAHQMLGEVAKARGCLEEALDIARNTGNRGGEATAVASLGVLLQSLGEYGRARECLEKSLALCRELGNRSAELNALGNLGGLHNEIGDYARAREVLAEALLLAREMGERAAEMASLGNLGNTYRSLGDGESALALYEQAYALAREMGSRQGEANSFGSLGLVHRELGEESKAKDYFERHLSLARELGDRKGELAALNNLGNSYLLGEEMERARESYEELLSLSRERGDRDGEATALGNLGALHSRLQDHGKAREFAKASLSLREEIGVEPNALSPLATLVKGGIVEGNPSEAEESFRKAEAILDRLPVRGLEIAEARGWRSRYSGWGELAQDWIGLRLSKARTTERTAILEEGFGRAGRWKGRGLLEGIAEHRRGGRSAKAIDFRRQRRETLARRDRILERVSRAVREGKAPEEVAALREEAQDALAKAESLGERLREISPRDASLDAPLAADLEEVRRVLGRKTALVEYAEGEESLYAYVLTERTLDRIDFGEKEAIGEEIERYLSAIGDPESLGTLSSVAESGRALFDRLLAPALRAAGEGIERLEIVPTAPLSALPFEALVAKAAEVPRTFADLQFVLDRYEVGYAPSSPVLVELGSLGPPRPFGKVLVLADPLYGSEAKEARPRPGSGGVLSGSRRSAGAWPRLEKTRDEARAVAESELERDEAGAAEALRRLADPRRRSGSATAGVFEFHWGAEASRRRLSGNLKNYSVLHIAAHGYAGQEFPQRTGVVLSSAEGEEGYFGAADVLELDLDANLVVLSACETARGRTGAAGEIESMARAFIYAGSRAVVASLWQVEDTAGAETMKAFYGGWFGPKNLPPPQALREAKLAVRRSGALRGVAGVKPGASLDSGHPFFWAPFVYIGLPR